MASDTLTFHIATLEDAVQVLLLILSALPWCEKQTGLDDNPA